ncbi:hypothetical protein GOV07_03265, partial [Candidatus Woesearchaeota archaeon]|nr:hypothetical protein [Candidatus Woesearchaeota archaeon]
GCSATLVGTYTFLEPPKLDEKPAERNVTVLEGNPLLFETKVPGAWSLDGENRSFGERFIYRPDFNDAGPHTVTLDVVAANGAIAAREWNVIVANANRPPVQVTEFIGLTFPIDEDFTFNLSYHFFDPDNTPLTYTVKKKPYPAGFVDPANISVWQQGEMVTLVAHAPGKLFFIYTAIDELGASAESEPVSYTVLTTNRSEIRPHTGYCGDEVCFIDESCTSCPKDCGDCAVEPCVPQWDCTEWGECVLPGFQSRECFVVNGCNETSEQPSEYQACDYNPTCEDGVKNGNETGIDCGGPCDACPTCEDGLLNQGEEDVDCGGPCDACPSCSDGLLNLDESDVDCGGSCPPCPLGARCTLPIECESRLCIDATCHSAGCSDGIINQGEEGIDCGGPCDVCPTCDDGVQNQGEKGVDCGGQCSVCPTCEDGLRNQGETVVDCGGPCRECTMDDYLPVILRWLGFAGILLGLILFVWFAHSIVASRMTFLFSHGKGIHFFYEDGLTYALLRFFNNIGKHLRFHRDKDAKILVAQTISELKKMRALPDNVLHMQLVAKLRELHGSLTRLGAAFTFEALVEHVRMGDLPFAVKVIMLRNTKLLYIIEKTRYYPSASFAIDEALAALEELRQAY